MLRFSVAFGPQRLDARRLQALVYSEDLGHIPDDGLDAVAAFIVALSPFEEVVASFRLAGPELRPFDFERHLSLDRLAGPTCRPALVGRLCLRREYRSAANSIPIQDGLLRFAIATAEASSITDLFLYTYEHLVSFYRGALFEDTGVLFRHGDWGLVRLMRLKVATAIQRLATKRARAMRHN